MKKNLNNKKKVVMTVVFTICLISFLPMVESFERPDQIIENSRNANTLYVGGGGPNNYTSIQDAIDNASNGDTIFVYSGLYFENIVVNKSVNIVGEEKHTTIIDGGGIYTVLRVDADSVEIKELSIAHSLNKGISLRSNFNKVSDTIIYDCFYGIMIRDSQDNEIIHNNISGALNGIVFRYDSENNSIVLNKISNNEYGIVLDHYSENNLIINNMVRNSVRYGIYNIGQSRNNLIYHNSFINNTFHAYEQAINIWDDGYPNGGNYWDDYTGDDLFSGPDQNISGSDGIGDIPYPIRDETDDHYPLMNTAPTLLFVDISGPYHGLINKPIEFNGFVFGGSPPYLWSWDFGDANTSDLQKPIHTYTQPGKYIVNLTVTDNNSLTFFDDTFAYIKTSNIPPNIPDVPTGPSSGHQYFTNEFSSTTIDEDGDDLYYQWEFIDGSGSKWLGPYNSGEQMMLSNIWNSPGIFNVKVRVNDLWNISEWSEPHNITIYDIVCGDSNNDSDINIGDSVFVLNYVFKGGPAPDPLCEGDANGDGSVNVGDAVYLIGYVFKGGSPPYDGCCFI